MSFRVIDGFDLGDTPSDGERMCVDCWDESEHDTAANCCIRKGRPIYWRQINVEYDEWSAYCGKHARIRAEEVY